MGASGCDTRSRGGAHGEPLPEALQGSDSKFTWSLSRRADGISSTGTISHLLCGLAKTPKPAGLDPASYLSLLFIGRREEERNAPLPSSCPDGPRSCSVLTGRLSPTALRAPTRRRQTRLRTCIHTMPAQIAIVGPDQLYQSLYFSFGMIPFQKEPVTLPGPFRPAPPERVLSVSINGT